VRLRIGLLLAGVALVVSANPAAAGPASERAAAAAPAQQAAARAATSAALAEARRQLKAARERYRRSADPTAPSGSARDPGSTTGPSAPGAPGESAPGSDDSDPPPPPLPEPGTGARNLQVRAGEFWLSLSKPAVPAGNVRVEFNNIQAEDPHDLYLVREDGSGGVYSFGVLGSGDVESKTFPLSAGTWSLFCALPEHAERGMTARLTVSGA
jgi:hypothetical protein